MKANPVGWFEIYVQNMNRAKRFYESVFDCKLERMDSSSPELWAFAGKMNSYGAPGALVHMEGFDSGKNSVIVYFSSDDCSIEEGKAKNHGGHVIKPKSSIGKHGFICLVKDTEGNIIGIHSLS